MQSNLFLSLNDARRYLIAAGYSHDSTARVVRTIFEWWILGDALIELVEEPETKMVLLNDIT